jgi:hypothetical protein
MSNQIKIDGSRLCHKNLLLMGTKDNLLQPLSVHPTWKKSFLPIGTNLSHGATWYVNGGTETTSTLPTVFDLPDDTYTIIVQSANFSLVTFTVTAGIIDYLHSIDSIVSGRGTNTLTLLGVKITIDARYLIGKGVLLDGVWKDFKALFTGNFLPNLPTHTYSFIVGSGIVASINFRIDISGKVFFDTKYNVYAYGNNTNTLTLLGYPILVDGRNTSLFKDANPVFSMVDNHNPSSVTNVILGNYLPLAGNISQYIYLLKMDSADNQKGFHIDDNGVIISHSSVSHDTLNGIRRITVN